MIYNPAFKRSDDFLTQVEKSIYSEIDSKGYARRKAVTLRLWYDHKLCKRASAFFIEMLEKEGKIKNGNRGVYKA